MSDMALVLFSGGIGSWAAAHRTIARGYDVELLFTDTRIEDEDLYRFLDDMGFPHNNCGGFCVKQGQAAFVNLLKTMPERYAYHEQKEADFREDTGKDVAILRDRRGGETKPLTLQQLREDYEAQPEQLTLDDWGGCGCMID